MAERKIKKNDYIATIGYDGLVAVVNKAQSSAVNNMSFEALLEAGNIKLAAACAIYENDEAKKQKVVDTYNQLSKGHYTTSKLEKLFGISSHDAKKVLAL